MVEAGDTDVRYLLDGAHNPTGVHNLALTLSEEYMYRRLILVWGAMIDKDIVAGLSSMLPLVDTFILTRPEGERSAEPEQLQACLPEAARDRGVLVRDVAAALREAEKLAGAEDMIVVAGSLYLVGAVLVFLYAPLLVLMIFSFNDSKRNVVWRGFTTKYYEKALDNDTLVEALINSLTILIDS